MAEHSEGEFFPEEDLEKIDAHKQPFSRRDFLKKAVDKTAKVGIGAAAGRGLLATTKRILDNPEPNLFEAIGKDYKDAILFNDPEQNSFPEQEDLFIKDMEERLGIRLVGIREAYALLGVEFNEYNTEEFNNVLPMRWDHERAMMVENFCNLLPDFFHEPDGNGHPLIIALTNFAENSNVAGNYTQDGLQNLIRLDYDQFHPYVPALSMSIFTHECIHHLQKMGYSRMDQCIRNVFKQDVHTFCDNTVKKMEELDKEGIQWNTELRYGVQGMDDKSNLLEIRSDSLEFEATLGQIYLHGHDVFIQDLSVLYGEKAEDLYAYMRDSIFGGKEYDEYPVDASFSVAVKV